MKNEKDKLDEKRHNAKTVLTEKQKEIKEKKPKPSKVGESVMPLQPSKDKDLKTIKYYNPSKVS